MSRNPENLHFYSDGLRIAATAYPAMGSCSPAVILVHGYSGKRSVFGTLPERLQSAGFTALTIDNRGFNMSEGQRNRPNPFEQTQDVIDAVTYLQSREDIDPKRIGIFGTSWGGGVAIVAAALDARIQVIVTSTAVADGARWLRQCRTEQEWSAFTSEVNDAAQKRTATGEPAYLELSKIMISDKHSAAAASRYPTPTTNAVPYHMESVEWCLRWHPVWFVDKIAPRPVLTIYAENDQLVPPDQQLALYEACGEPKNLIKLAGANHYDSYELINPDIAETMYNATIDWYSIHL